MPTNKNSDAARFMYGRMFVRTTNAKRLKVLQQDYKVISQVVANLKQDGFPYPQKLVGQLNQQIQSVLNSAAAKEDNNLADMQVGKTAISLATLQLIISAIGRMEGIVAHRNERPNGQESDAIKNAGSLEKLEEAVGRVILRVNPEFAAMREEAGWDAEDEAKVDTHAAGGAPSLS